MFFLICQPCFPLTLSWNCLFFLTAGTRGQSTCLQERAVGRTPGPGCVWVCVLWAHAHMVACCFGYSFVCPVVWGRKQFLPTSGHQRSFLGEDYFWENIGLEKGMLSLLSPWVTSEAPSPGVKGTLPGYLVHVSPLFLLSHPFQGSPDSSFTTFGYSYRHVEGKRRAWIIWFESILKTCQRIVWPL